MNFRFRSTFFALLVVLVSFSANGQDRSAMDAAVGKFQHYYNAKQYDSIYNMLSTRIQGLMNQDKTRDAMGQLNSQMGEMQTVKYSRKDDKMNYYSVAFTKMEMILITSLDNTGRLDAFRFVPANGPEPAKQKAAQKGASDMILKTGTGNIYGTLTMPEGTAKVPVVLFIAGSGPTDRNGNNAMGVTAYCYRMLADSLRDAGIACLRYDKRGIGQSAASLKDEAALSFDSMVSDAVGYVHMLQADARFSEVIVMGHSEGSLIGMIVARKANVKKYISLAGAGEAADKILRVQLAVQSEETAAKAEKIMDSLKKGYVVKNIDADLMMLFRPSAQPYMRSWLKYDPQVEIKKLKMPILIIQGGHDLQVPQKHGEQLKKAAPKAQLLLLSDMSHVLKDAPLDPEKNMAAYKSAELPLSPGLAAGIIGFIKK